MGVGSSDFEDKSDVRFRRELIHQQLIGEIMDDNSEHFSDAPTHLSWLSIEAPETTLHSDASTARNDVPNSLTRRTYRPIQEIRQDLRDNLRREMTELINWSWEEDILINDAFGEEFSLNNLFIFQANSSSHVVEGENQASIGTQDELSN